MRPRYRRVQLGTRGPKTSVPGISVRRRHVTFHCLSGAGTLALFDERRHPVGRNKKGACVVLWFKILWQANVGSHAGAWRIAFSYAS